MEQSPLRLIKRKLEHLPQSEINSLPLGLRGIYVLYQQHSAVYNVVYVGMARSGGRGGIRGRLKSHRRNKGDLWTNANAPSPINRLAMLAATRLRWPYSPRHACVVTLRACHPDTRLAA